MNKRKKETKIGGVSFPCREVVRLPLKTLSKMFSSKELYLEEKEKRFNKILPIVLREFYKMNTSLSGKLSSEIFTQIKKITSARVTKSFKQEAQKPVITSGPIRNLQPVVASRPINLDVVAPRSSVEVIQCSCCRTRHSIIESLHLMIASVRRERDYAQEQRDGAVALSIKLQEFIDDLKKDYPVQDRRQSSSRSVTVEPVVQSDSLIEPVIVPTVKTSSWFSRLSPFSERLVPDCPEGTMFVIWDKNKFCYSNDCIVFEKGKFNLYGVHETGYLRLKAYNMIRTWVVGATYVCLDGKYGFATDKPVMSFIDLPVVRKAQSKGFYLLGMRPVSVPIGRIIRME